jgi:hypothetical protein
MFIEKLVVARLSRPDAADLVTAEDSGVDVAALREEATAIRVNLEEMASDRALGKITHAQMLKATACLAAEQRYGLRCTAAADHTAARYPTRAESEKAARRGLAEAPGSRCGGMSPPPRQQRAARASSSPAWTRPGSWCVNGHAAAHIRAMARTHPAAAADAAWATSGTLHVAAAVLGSRILRQAADALDCRPRSCRSGGVCG